MSTNGLVPVGAADVGNDDVQPGAVVEGHIAEWAAQIDSASTVLQHAFDEVVHVVCGVDGRCELSGPTTRNEFLPEALMELSLVDGSPGGGLLAEPSVGEDRAILRPDLYT
ncbi:hypothetical protein [Humibacillus xanthopallidus]|uniref:hypothetical protein n=1 Tax=Humibacillus xanthopallidus TaxID=412689 RepID=UPI001639B2A5